MDRTVGRFNEPCPCPAPEPGCRTALAPARTPFGLPLAMDLHAAPAPHAECPERVAACLALMAQSRTTALRGLRWYERSELQRESMMARGGIILRGAGFTKPF